MVRKNKKGSERREQITSNMEDYLEAIYEIGQETEVHDVRVSDIARRLKVSRPSVVGMIKHLAEHGLSEHDHYGGVRLSSQGREVAREMLHRHLVLRRFLEEVLGLDAQVAEEDACRMEHALSKEAIDRFMALEEFRKREPNKGVVKDESFRRFLRDRNKSTGANA